MLPRMWQACQLAGSSQFLPNALRHSAATRPLHTSFGRLANDSVPNCGDSNTLLQAMNKRFISKEDLFFWGCLSGIALYAVKSTMDTKLCSLGYKVDRTERSAEWNMDAKVSDLKWELRMELGELRMELGELRRDLGNYKFNQAGELGRHQGELIAIHRHRRQLGEEIEELRQSMAAVMVKLEALQKENEELRSQLSREQTPGDSASGEPEQHQ